ncbi:sulfatase-like hydrolase/transferase [Labilibacter marinus]|uniref:sulfatase-like hydrolase/transferase n=1 Tax=Labilibacter marinus TaxID=1477105 RepID=UPI00094F80CC|nr:sulfatase-like hydrolase/transferase [Labilibacter marinus]
MKKNKIVLCLAFALCLSAFSQLMAKGKSKQPNIIFVMVDDCSAVEFSSYATSKHPAGNRTPVIDGLAKEGLRFTTCWATPLCMPTRALLMSGKYGCKTGVFGNKLNKHDDNFAKQHIPISKKLQENGYETAISGKWHIPGYAEEEHSGWDEYSLLGGYMKPYKKDVVWDGRWFSWKKAADTFLDTAVIGKNKQLYPALYWHGAVYQNGQLLPSNKDTYAPDLNQQFALEFIKKDRDKPFFLYYPMVLPHDPWLPTPANNDANKKSKPGFNSLVDRLEFYMDELIHTVKEQGLYENTIIFFTADNATLANGKGSCSELGVRVPLVVAGGPLKKHGTSDVLIDFSDMYPTILDLAGISEVKDNALDGLSFEPLLKGKKHVGKEYIFSYLDMERTVRSKEYMMDGSGGIWKCASDGNILDYIKMPEDKKTKEIRANFLKQIEAYTIPTTELFSKERIEKASRNYPWPSYHPSMVNAIKQQDNWMNNKRRMKE